MAEAIVKISELDELMSFATGDILVINDISEPLDIDKTKRISVANLVKLVTHTAVQAIVSGQAEGDLFYASSATALARLAKGTDGQVLKMGASLPGWGAGGATVLLEESVLSSTATNFEFSDITGDYNHLLVRLLCRSNYGGGSISLKMTINRDASSNYDHVLVYESSGGISMTGYLGGSDPLSHIYIPGATATADAVGFVELFFPFYSNTVFDKTYSGKGFAKIAVSGNWYDALRDRSVRGTWRNKNAITSVKVYPNSGSFVAGSICQLYGLY